MQRHNVATAVPRLATILLDSTLTRENLCHMLAGLMFRIKDGDEAAAREEIYRILVVAEATADGTLKL